MKAKSTEEEPIGLYCWGENLKNQLGLPASCSTNVSKPQKVKVMSTSQRMPYIVACGESHTFILTVKSELFMAGAGTNGQRAGALVESEPAPPRTLHANSSCCELAFKLLWTTGGETAEMKHLTKQIKER